MALSPFFIAMHLPKLPTVFVKGGEERKAYFTIQAKELLEAGWAEKSEEPVKEEAKAEPKAEAKPRATKVKTESKKEEDDA